MDRAGYKTGKCKAVRMPLIGGLTKLRRKLTWLWLHCLHPGSGADRCAHAW